MVTITPLMHLHTDHKTQQYLKQIFHHFQQYFNDIVVVIFIGGGKRNMREKTTDIPQISVIY
jgi:intracellular sulfur oxidation DsrE/DsrF family protein